MIFKHLKSNEIDIVKWDNCIGSAFNGVAYAYSWYLNIVCKGWEALIAGDYDYVMPITIGRKYGIYYLYQPFWTQQLGVFTTKELDSSIVNSFLKHIPQKYKFIEINLNKFSKPTLPDFKIVPKVNYELNLIKPYDEVASEYSKNHKKNIKKAKNKKLFIKPELKPNELINLVVENIKCELKAKNVEILRQLFSYTVSNNIGEIYGVYNENSVLCAASFIIKIKDRAIILVSASTAEGKKKSAMYLLIDEFIRQNAGQNITLDFEGSNIPSIAYFFGGFHAIPHEYWFVKRNTLPWYIKLMTQ